MKTVRTYTTIELAGPWVQLKYSEETNSGYLTIRRDLKLDCHSISHLNSHLSFDGGDIDQLIQVLNQLKEEL